MTETGRTKKSRRLTPLIIILAVLLAALAGGAAAYFYSSRPATTEQAAAYIESKSAAGRTDFLLPCAPELFSLLTRDPASLERVKVRAGVDAADVDATAFGEILIWRGVTYTDAPWAECANTSEARDAIRDFTARRETAFTLLCPADTVSSLRDDGLLRPYLAMGGVFERTEPDLSPELGTVRVSALVYTDEPYAAVTDEADFAAAVEGFCEQGLTSFCLAFDPDYFDSYVNDADTRLCAQAASKLSFFASMSDAEFCTVRYSEVEYTDVPRFVCRTEEDVVAAIAAMGTDGGTAFELFLPDKELADALAQENFARLGELEQLGGMITNELSYSHDGDRLIYKAAKIVPDARQVRSLPDVIDYLDEQAAAGSMEIYFFCDPGTYDTLIAELFSPGDPALDARIQDLLPQAGIFDSVIGSVRDVVYVSVKEYFPGTSIVRAMRVGDLSALSDRETETMDAAVELAGELKADEPRDTALAIHDWLCDNVVYTDDEDTDEDDTAIGAILNGEANCDGYSDAFYLIGTLAGLHVRYQHGDSLDAERERSGDEAVATHLWNLLELDGTWRMVDVTFDDEDEAEPCRVWFDIGSDRASRTHIWHSDATVPLRETTDLSARPANEYTVNSYGDVYDAAVSAANAGCRVFRLVYDDPSLAAGYEDDLYTIGDQIGYDFQYSWNSDMLMLAIYRD